MGSATCSWAASGVGGQSDTGTDRWEARLREGFLEEVALLQAEEALRYAGEVD